MINHNGSTLSTGGSTLQLSWRGLALAAVVVSSATLTMSSRAWSQTTAEELLRTRHWSGQTVQPVYDGFDENPDGTFNMWFGYMNRNYKEELDLPVGPENNFSPGPADRGQPTHFVPRRNKDIFKVVVPKDFQGALTWTLVSHGKTLSVPGTLNQVFMIDRKYTTRGGNDTQISSNRPPEVTVTPKETTVTVGTPLTLSLTATDDGLPVKRGRYSISGGDPVGLTLEWTKFRGPGMVTFAPGEDIQGRTTLKLQEKSTQTLVTFSEPGEYVLQAVVDDGSRGNYSYHCCWTNADVKVTVKGAPPSTAQR